MSTEGRDSETFDLAGGFDLVRPSVSPNGKFVAFFYAVKNNDENNIKLAVLPLSNTKVTPKISPAVPVFRDQLKWMPDSSAYVYVHQENGAMNLRAVPIDGSPPYFLTNFTDSLILNQFDFSPDGKHLVIARGPVLRNIVLIKNFN